MSNYNNKGSYDRWSDEDFKDFLKDYLQYYDFPEIARLWRGRQGQRPDLEEDYFNLINNYIALIVEQFVEVTGGGKRVHRES